MSLPNYLAKIKSAGIYRFVWDKSVVPPQQAETLRLLVGYSEKGPFNTPVYIESYSDFKSIYGNISKRLERKGACFHRMAEQALQAGPILAFNIKPFNEETVSYVNFNGVDIKPESTIPTVPVKNIYDTNRFWALDADKMIENIAKVSGTVTSGYITLATTDTKDSSCTVVMRKTKPASYAGITLRSWCATQGVEPVGYLEKILDEKLEDFFADIYVFRGEFTKTVVDSFTKNGINKYFTKIYETTYITVEEAKKYATHIYDAETKKYVEATEGATHAYDEKSEKYVDMTKATHIYDDETKKYVEATEGATHVAKNDFRYAAVNSKTTNVMGKEIDALEALANDPNSNFVGVYSGCLLPQFKDANGNYISLDLKFNADHNKHKMLMKLDNNLLENAENAEGVKKYLVGEIAKENPSKYPTVYLPGYIYNSIDMKGDTLWTQCKSVLSDPGVYEALTNRVDIEYHYIIDTFDTDTDESKAELFSLAKDKDNAFAIVNFPKMSKWGKVEGGADAYKNIMPGESEGASFGAYYTQLTFTDGAIKSVIPSAALVSNNFMQKWGPRQPYYIVAGPNYGALTYSGLVGPDYNFGRSDLDILEPMGVNAIIYVPRLGTYINSNQTAKQTPVSGLSKVHIRELVIYLQNEIEHLLQSYQWELNTQPLRDTIKAKADAICEKIMNNGGIYAFVNICNETNNTPEVIDNEMIILDTEIEPARGAGKMVHQLTIHRTGGLTSSVK